MSFFEHFFNDTIFDKEETMVCCPFPHKTANGLEYFDSNPSAGVNLSKGVFHCLSCNRAHSEVGFIATILDCSYETASRFKSVFDKNDSLSTWKELGTLPEELKRKTINLGISEKVIQEINIQSEDGVAISFPVAMYDAILDVRNYRPENTPKIRSRRNAISGLILPYNQLIESDKSKWVLLCAGEKDMAVARSHGFNAITVTGGELTLPIFRAPFKGRKVAIAYDNDAPGKEGARKIAAFLKPIAAEVRVVEGFHEICAIDKEDITDFFTKYGGTRQMLIDYIKNAPAFTDEEYDLELEKSIPTLSLMAAATPKFINKTIRSNIQVVATNESSYVIPTAVEAYKTESTKDNDLMSPGEKKSWYFEENTAKDILHLMDNNFTEEAVAKNLRSLLHIPSRETNVKVRKLSKEVVFKCTVTDLFETSTDNTSSIEYSAYVVGKKLDSGKKYRATYRLVPHPYDGQKLIMIILDIEEANDSVTNFKITPPVVEHLDVVRAIPGNLTDKINVLTNMARGLTKFDTDATLIQAIDFAYNTVLEFNFKNFTHVRGFLDTIIVTESRVGKSTTAEALQKTYGLGVFTSLAGSSATVAGIIGGSNKVGGSFQTRAGLIPQNHKGLIVFEELAKCNSQMLKELTDVKSSGRARITRVNGALDLPASVRMISLTNPRASHTGISRPITSYPNGIEILTDLIGTAEDIARFDLMLVQAFRGGSMQNSWQLPETLPLEVYRTRIRWIWSRKAHNIKFMNDTENYIVEECNKLNEEYDSHIKIFGTEAWKKVSRLAIAVAGITVSTDSTYENILVTHEHVDYAINFFKRVYDNDTFRLKEYVEMERRFEEEDEDGVHALQNMYLTFPALLLQLENSSNATRAELMAATGLNQDQFSSQLNLLIQQSCIRFQGQLIIPTLRFRKCMRKVNRSATLKRLGGHRHGPTL